MARCIVESSLNFGGNRDQLFLLLYDNGGNKCFVGGKIREFEDVPPFLVSITHCTVYCVVGRSNNALRELHAMFPCLDSIMAVDSRLVNCRSNSSRPIGPYFSFPERKPDLIDQSVCARCSTRVRRETHRRPKQRVVPVTKLEINIF